jgi:hypothetical protein
MYAEQGRIDWNEVAFEEPAPVVLRTRPFRSIEDIKRAVAKRYRVTVADLEDASRARMFAHPRQVAMALSYRKLKRFGYSLPLIGKHFGGRDHTTVLFAVRKIGTKGRSTRGNAGGASHVQRAALDRMASQ